MDLKMRILGLVIGFIAKFVTGSLFVFNVYQGSIKNTFNYTQKEMEILPSLLNVGLGIGFVPGAMFDRFGPKWTSVAGLVISVPAYILLWSTTKSVEFYSKNSWLMSIYFFLCGFGSVFTYMVALNTNIINFDKKHAGKIVGFLNAFFAGSPSIFSVIYYNTFNEEGNDSDAFSGFMLMFAILFAVVDVLCIAFLKKDKNPRRTARPEVETSTQVTSMNTISTVVAREEDAMDSTKDVTVSTKQENEKMFDPDRHTSLSLKKIIRNIDYHIFVWLFALLSSIGLVYGNNLTTISNAMPYGDSYDNRLTIIIPITNAILSTFIGLFSDFFREKVPKLWMVNFATLCLIISQCLVLFYADHIGVLVTATVFAGAGIGIVWSLFPIIAQEWFYIGNIGRNWGIAILVAAALGFVAQTVFGAFYDHEITTSGTTHCHGMKCIRAGTIMTVAFGITALILGIFAQVKRQLKIRRINTYEMK